MVVTSRAITHAAIHLLKLGHSVEMVVGALIELLKRSHNEYMTRAVVEGLHRCARQELEYMKVRFIVARSSDGASELIDHMLGIIGAHNREYVVEVQPELIGGFVARLESQCYDYSVKNILLQMERNYKKDI